MYFYVFYTVVTSHNAISMLFFYTACPPVLYFHHRNVINISSYAEHFRLVAQLCVSWSGSRRHSLPENLSFPCADLLPWIDARHKILCREPASPAHGKQMLTAYLTVAHGESWAHGRLWQKLTVKHGTRRNKLKTHGRVEPTANCWSGPTFEAGLTAQPDGRHLPCALQSRTVNCLPRKFKIIAAQIFKIWNMSVPTICRELSRKAHGIDTFCRVLWWPAHGKPFILPISPIISAYLLHLRSIY
jgi:hypothetical protein